MLDVPPLPAIEIECDRFGLKFDLRQSICAILRTFPEVPLGSVHSEPV